MIRNSLALIALLLTAGTRTTSPVGLDYTLHFQPGDLSAITVELRIGNAPAALQLAAHAHPEYDDKYWRYIDAMSAVDGRGRTVPTVRIDSVRWQVGSASRTAGDITVRYRVRFPAEGTPRSSWRPFLSATGGLVGGPHSFLYVVGLESTPASVTLDVPDGWRTATGLAGPSTGRTFNAPDIFTLMESPMLVGALHEWPFTVRNVPHRVFYWPLPDATPFDSTRFVASLEKIATGAINLFGSAPYTAYTFLFQDGAYIGGLEHPNSVTLGAPSGDLARSMTDILHDTAHEFFHTWNLMAIKPVEYRKVDYQVQPPVAELWFSEGLTMFYADLLLRRAGLAVEDTTRVAHLENLIRRYIANSGNQRFSAEQVSRVAYNAPEDALGDYSASAHVQGELIGSMLDLLVRDATDGRASMDDVMREVYQRFTSRPFNSRDIQRTVDEVCRCSSARIFDGAVTGAGLIDVNQYLAPLGLTATTSWTPALERDGTPSRDFSIRAWQAAGETGVRLRIFDPTSIWARAGIHTGDKLVSVNGGAINSWPELRQFISRFAFGDSATFVVQRAGRTIETRVVMQQRTAPVVRIASVAGASERQRRLRDSWQRGQ